MFYKVCLIFSDWKVLHLILQEVPQVMQNKALILSRHGNDIDYLAAALCSMVRPCICMCACINFVVPRIVLN
jgi:hypothetical protein